MIDLPSQPIGRVCVAYPDYAGLPWWRRWLLKIVYWGITQHQRNIWPHGKTDAIHLYVKIAGGEAGKWFEMTVPCGALVELRASLSQKLRVYEYEYAKYFTEEQWAAFRAYLVKLIGVAYDPVQLPEIAIHEAFGWLPETITKERVCSTAVFGAFYAAWQLFPFGTGALCALPAYGGRIYPKPNARLHNGTYTKLEHVPPAFCDNERQWILVEDQNC